MAKLKIKDIEGDAGEIKNLFKDMGCDLNSYLNTTAIQKTIPRFWLYILIPVFFILSCCIWVNTLDTTWTKVSILGIFLLLGAIILIIQYNHRDWKISTIAGITGFCIILIALNVYSPTELAKKIEEKAGSKLENK